jgi:4-hydroxy-tetrahydrodipicolinate synthase
VLEEIRQFESLEPDFIVAVTPYYYDAPQEVIIQHYREIAKQSPVPVILYDPSETNSIWSTVMSKGLSASSV